MRAWPALCFALGGASATVWWIGSPDALTWHAATWWREPWTLWTASLTHLSGAHLLGNLLAIGALGVLGASLDLGRPQVVAVLLAWPLVTLGLLAWPEVTGYSGLSGLIHALVGVLWSFFAIYSIAKPLSFVIFAGLCFKLLAEQAWEQPVAFDPSWGFNVVYAAHLSGALAGVSLGLVLTQACRMRLTRAVVE